MVNLSQTDVILSKSRLVHIIFIVKHGDIFSHLGRYESLDSQQNGAAVDVSVKMMSYSCFYWKKYDFT